jgi:sulfate adenylyltransferase large subunit
MADLLRLCTAGSVDDGKSTLIGRLLYDSRAVYDDQVRSVERATRPGAGIDFSLFTDGLKAEREQGITIDVAYRYFSTPRRSFILADTPGHEQYTRNMATGASTADLAILLVDARHGVRPQSERHARIAQLLGISDFVVAVNKMDLVGFDRGVFDGIASDFGRLLAGARVQPIPVSALHGDNITTPSTRTPWYGGPTLLRCLETASPLRGTADAPFRFPVQLVTKHGDFRGYAGQIVSGRVHAGDRLTTWPSGHAITVRRIVTWDGDLDGAEAPASVTLVPAEEIDLARGDVIASGAPAVSTRFVADLVWMDERPLDPARVYLLKQSSRTVPCELDRALALNEIGEVTVTAARPIVFDRYASNRATGCFVLIDPATSFTAGAGMIAAAALEPAGITSPSGRAAERLARLARTAATEADAVEAVRHALEELLV